LRLKFWISCALQAAFVEQELNWGEEQFQLRTYFGRKDSENLILRNSTPRDLIMVLLEKCYEDLEQTNQSAEFVVRNITKSYRSKSLSTYMIAPPLDRLPSRRKGV